MRQRLCGANYILSYRADTQYSGSRLSNGCVDGSGARCDNERRPVAGVWVGRAPMMDTVVAETFTDAQGRYRICGLPRE